MPFVEFRELDLSRLEDAPIINTLPVETCEDIDGDGHCYCVAPQPDPDSDRRRSGPKQHAVYQGVNAGGRPHTSRRYFRL